MAVTRVTHTSKGYDAIDYALNGKPHVADKVVSGRVMASSGVNCTVHGCRQQMNAVWRRYGINRPTKRHRRQVQRLIQSFDPNQLSYKNPKDVAKANAIGRKLVSKLYPYRQSIVVTQADNTHHILHNHCISNMLDFRTGKSMNGKQTSWSTIQRASDSVIRSYGLNPTANKRMIMTANGRKPKSPVHRTDAEYHIKKSGRYSWADDIRNRISRAKNEATSWSSFISLCHKNGVICNPYRKHKGGIRRDKDGKPVFKKHISFRFIGKDKKKHRIRDRKLGTSFEREALSRSFVEKTMSAVLRPKFSYGSNSEFARPTSRSSSESSESYEINPDDDISDDPIASFDNAISADYIEASQSASLSASVSASTSARASSASSVVASRSNNVVKRNSSYNNAISSASSAYSSKLGIVRRSSYTIATQPQNLAHINGYSSIASKQSSAYNKLVSLSSNATNARQRLNPAIRASRHEKHRVLTDIDVLRDTNKPYARWAYNHLIPNGATINMYHVGYDGRVPEFADSPMDKDMIHNMISPIINGFLKGKAWTATKWRAGKSALKQYAERHNVPKLNYMAKAKSYGLFSAVRKEAKHFYESWGNVKDVFNNKFIKPAEARLHDIRINKFNAVLPYELASNSYKSISSSANHMVNSYVASSASATTLALTMQYSHAVSFAKADSSTESSLSYMHTPAGQNSIKSSMQDSIIKRDIRERQESIFASQSASTSSKWSSAQSKADSRSASISIHDKSLYSANHSSFASNARHIQNAFNKMQESLNHTNTNPTPQQAQRNREHGPQL